MSSHQKNLNYALEYMKCKLNPLYFIEKYIKIPTAGGAQPIASEDLWYKTNKYRLWIKSLYKFKKVISLFPRQTGKTTLALALDLWYANFYGLKIGFVTIDKARALDAISRIRFMHDHLPIWLKTPAEKSTSTRLLYFKLENGAHIRTAYVSSTTPPESIFRGLSLPVLSLDELAFVPHADLMLGSIGPAYSKASREAEEAGMPHGIQIFSTPNGAQGLFYDMYMNGTPVEELLVDPTDNKCDQFLPDDELHKIVNQPGRNGYVIIKLNWREVYDETWYEEQKRTLNFDRRKIAQEIDLVFLGSSNSVFDDEIFIKLKPASSYYTKSLFNNAQLKILEDLDPNDFYVIGVDTAASSSDNADYSAISIWNATHNKQVGELKKRIPVLKHYAKVIKEIVLFMINDLLIDEDRIRLAIERNSYGLGVIEELIYDEEYGDLFTRIIYYSEVKKEMVPGLHTSPSTRPILINNLIQTVNETPESIRGPETINELRTLEQKANGRIEAARGFHDDLVMATAFAITVRKRLIKEGVLETSDTPIAPVKLDSILTRTIVQNETSEEEIETQIITDASNKSKPNSKLDYSIYNVF